MYLRFLFTEIPTILLNLTVNATGSGTITATWMHPINYELFDIKHYDINVSSRSGVQQMTTACGQCTNTTVTVSEDPIGSVTVTIAAINQCGEAGPTATASKSLLSYFDI